MHKRLKFILLIIAVVFGVIGIFSFFLIIFNSTYHFNETNAIDANLASQFGGFFGGFIGTIFSIVSILLLIYTILHQNSEAGKTALETNFFRMIDYHNQNVDQLKIPHLKLSKKDDIWEGRRAFVQFKIQIHELFKIVNQIVQDESYSLTKEQIADIVYMIFYYGIDGSWVDFIKSKLERYRPHHTALAQEIQRRINLNFDLKIGRTNQTHLSTYFRNMYNAVKKVDQSKFLDDKEKMDLIKIYRAQLSNPELYVLFFNVFSRFGKKWVERKYILKYELLKNIPHNYCDGYIPNTYFPMEYEDDEY